MESLQAVMIEANSTFRSEDAQVLPSIHVWTKYCADLALTIRLRSSNLYLAHPDATPYLGFAPDRMYELVREQLGGSFLQARHLICATTHSESGGIFEINDGTVGSFPMSSWP